MSMHDSDFRDAPDPTTNLEFEWGENYEYFVEAKVEWVFEGHDGIGPYEYHGAKGYDQGDPIWEIDSITFTVWDENSNEVKLSQEQQADLLQRIHEVAEPEFD